MGTRYSREEAEEILRRALQGAAEDAAGHAGQDAIDHEDLQAAAEEVGVSAEALDAAVAQMAAERRRLALEDRVLLRRQSAFGRLLVRCVLVGGALLALNLGIGMRMPLLPWLGSAVVAWVLLRARQAYFPSSAGLARAVDEEARREQRRAERDRARRRYQERAAERRARKQRTKAQFERAVDSGLQVLLAAAADTLESLSKEPPTARPATRVRVAEEEGQGQGQGQVTGTETETETETETLTDTATGRPR